MARNYGKTPNAALHYINQHPLGVPIVQFDERFDPDGPVLRDQIAQQVEVSEDSRLFLSKAGRLSFE